MCLPLQKLDGTTFVHDPVGTIGDRVQVHCTLEHHRRKQKYKARVSRLVRASQAKHLDAAEHDAALAPAMPSRGVFLDLLRIQQYRHDTQHHEHNLQHVETNQQEEDERKRQVVDVNVSTP